MSIYNKLNLINKKINGLVSIFDHDHLVKDNSLTYLAKDNINYFGYPTTASSDILNGYISPYNATVINKLNNSNAVCFGKTSMDGLGMGGSNLTANTGPVYNPYDLSRISGGSSGGSAAFNSYNIVDFTLGTDTGDSIRKPASYCGNIGVKPSYGRISRYGIIPYASSLDHVGYFTNSISKACKILDIIKGRDDKDMTSLNDDNHFYYQHLKDDLKGKKIGIIKNIYDLIYIDKLKNDLDDFIKILKDKGAIVEFVSLDHQLLQAILPTYLVIANCEASANHSNLDGIRFGNQYSGKDLDEIMINSRTNGLTYNIRKRFLFGSYGLYQENQELIFNKAKRVRRLIVDEYLSKTNDYDAIINLASLNVAPKINDISNVDESKDEYLIGENHLVIANFCGIPSLTMPFTTIDQLPIGININTKFKDEQMLFNIAYSFEKIIKINDLKDKINYEL